jgi:Trypsin-co-occurring domain 1
MEDGTIISTSGATFVPVKLDDNTIIRIEATEFEGNVVGQGYIAAVEMPSFQQVTDTIKSMAKSLVAVWNEVQPSKASVEFGIEIGFEPGKLTALLVKGSGKANLIVTLEWSKESSEER